MKKVLKNAIILAVIVLAILGVYFGSIRAFIKGKRYIEALGRRGQIESTEEFRENWKYALDYRAPISDDEIIKFLSGDIVNMASAGEQPEEVMMSLISFIEEYIDQNDVLHILNIGRTYHFMWVNYEHKEEYYIKAEEYYEKVLEIGPKLPPALYGILDLYRVKGDAKNAKKYGEMAFELWPQDERLKEILEKIEEIEASAQAQ
ncbi:hypothetical protein CL629_04300 [bacterium]|nr:hypothetical protein [bacterium]|tara:strand:- start:13448 stop:14059 length:612 start_codon:yes stop_codon:yes gene_type:complete